MLIQITLLTTKLPNLAGNNYFLYEPGIGKIELCVVTKSNNDYILYVLENKPGALFEVIQTTIIDIKFKQGLDAIFNNFVPKPGLKRYLSEYGIGLNHFVSGGTYSFSLFKNGVKTFECWLPLFAVHNNIIIESAFDDTTYNTLVQIAIVP